MKRHPHILTLLFMLFVFAACDKQTRPLPRPAEAPLREDPFREPEPAGNQDACPIGFPKHGLCAEVHWEVGPTADAKSSFVVHFWEKGRATSRGPYSTMGSDVQSLAVKSCGCVSNPEIERLADGEYRVKSILLNSGSWKVFLKVKDASAEEEQSIALQLP